MDLIREDLPERCPICNKDISSYTDELKRKHIDRCRRTKPKYVYSDRPCGRPPKRRPIKTPCRMAIIIGIFAIVVAFLDILLHLR